MATWTGLGTTTNWNDANNWSPVGAPNFVAVTIAYLPAALPITVDIASGQTFAADPLTLGISSAPQNITLNNAGNFTVNSGPATLYAGTELHNTGSVTFNGGAAIYGTLIDDGTLTMHGTATIEVGGLVQINAGHSGVADTSLVLDGTLRVNGTVTSPTAVTGNGTAIIDGGNLSGGGGNPLQITGASIGFTILDGGTLHVSTPGAGDSFTFGAVTTVHNTLIMPSFAGTVTSRIAAFSAGDLINLGASGSHSITANGGGSYTITYGSVTLTDVVLAAGTSSSSVEFTSGVISVLCFAAGTRIRTDRGDVAVETLRAGDQVTTLSGEHHPVRWIGERKIDLTRHPEPETAAPVRIRRGAIAEQVPARDLLVSPDHAIYLDGVLISARRLVNGTSITQDIQARTVHYFHVELDQHAILLAEDTPAETYLDTGNRDWFVNGGTLVTLHPMRAGLDRRTVSCAPFATDDAVVEGIWLRLADRAAAIGLTAPGHDIATQAKGGQPDLRILAGGRTIRPVSMNGLRAQFVLPEDCASIELLSAAARPTELRPWLDDRRRLGVSVARIRVSTGGELREIAVDDPALADGWWDVEQSGNAMWRWTDGRGRLELGTRGHAVLEVEFLDLPCHPADAPDTAIAARRVAAAG